ncbi:demethylrebeccamycin-D-glucose O-methyltransferase [Clostridiales bacterium]|nr:demethylrebeccamycin-D-glucose O-methyltransferase [Clostridiales bacterium]
MSKLDIIEKYWNMRSEGFSMGINDELESSHDKWKERLDRLLSNVRGKKILDIGCGPGFFSILLSELGYEVTAMDYSQKMLEEAEKNVIARGLSVNFERGDAQNLCFDNASFDAVVSRNLMWNLEKPDEAYRQWLRVLKKGGILINCDGNHCIYHFRKEYMLERLQPEYDDGHNPEYMKNVDVSIIENLSRELPLSKELRPTWDINFLINEGVSSIGADIERNEFTDSGENYSLIKNFVLRAIK